nr:PREDICTED: uncharacterized protein LOC105664362 isoform X2 [Megachile rotundata]
MWSLHGRLRFREIKYVRWFVLLYSKLLHRVHELQLQWFVLLHSKLLHEVHELQLSTVGSHQVAHM